MTRPQLPHMVAGDVVWIEEPDYLPGVGPLRLRVTGVGGTERQVDGWWLNLRGFALSVDGSPVNDREQYVLVRVEALSRQLKQERQP